MWQLRPGFYLRSHSKARAERHWASRACFLVIHFPVKREKRACPLQGRSERQSCSEGLTGKRLVAGHRERAFSLQRLSTTPGKQQAGPEGLGESYFSHAVVRQSLQYLPRRPLCPSLPLSSGPGPPAPRSSHLSQAQPQSSWAEGTRRILCSWGG